MAKIEKIQISANGSNNSKLVFVSQVLGVLDLIEKGVVSKEDANMLFFLPLMLRTEEDVQLYNIVSMASELDTYSPIQFNVVVQKLRKLCYELINDYSRIVTLKNEEKIVYEID